MKRFSETTKWDDPWFRGLKPPEKLLFLFLVDNCNNAGFYELDTGAVAFKTGMTESQIVLGIKGLGRGCLGADGWIWVRRFLRHQKNEELNPDNNAHKQIIEFVKDQLPRFSGIPEFQSFLGANEGLFSPIGKVKVQVKVQERGVGKTKFTPPSLADWLARAKEIGYPESDAEGAFHSYEAKGWMCGSNRMEKWRSAIQTCFVRWKNGGQLYPRNGSPPNNPHELVKCSDGELRFKSNCVERNGVWNVK